jgi:hypothetical protein
MSRALLRFTFTFALLAFMFSSIAIAKPEKQTSGSSTFSNVILAR